jgi:alcohol dehydrogenase class IV
LFFISRQSLYLGKGAWTGSFRIYKYPGRNGFFILTVPFLKEAVNNRLQALVEKGIACQLNASLNTEPGFEDFYSLKREAEDFCPDAVVGIGGGSVLDLAKLLAALIHSDQTLPEVVGIGLLKNRNLYLACLPTTAGTGSEVSPNAILLDEQDGMKKGIISPFLVPDAAYIDPLLTVGLPAAITAATGMDALAHCLEAYTNRFAHPMADLYALEGIRLIKS